MVLFYCAKGEIFGFDTLLEGVIHSVDVDYSDSIIDRECCLKRYRPSRSFRNLSAGALTLKMARVDV